MALRRGSFFAAAEAPWKLARQAVEHHAYRSVGASLRMKQPVDVDRGHGRAIENALEAAASKVGIGEPRAGC